MNNKGKMVKIITLNELAREICAAIEAAGRKAEVDALAGGASQQEAQARYEKIVKGLAEGFTRPSAAPMVM